MTKQLRRLAAFFAAAVASLALGLATAPAHASFTPVGASVTGVSTDAALTITLGGRYQLTFRCPRNELRARVNATGTSLSGDIWFANSLPTTCTENLFGTSLGVTSSGLLTLTLTSSTAGVGASGDFSLDRGFWLQMNSLACNLNIQGPQGPFTGAVTFDQATQVLTITARGIAATNCPTPVDFTATFAMAPRFTIS
jgi:hypothetical protein